MAAPTHVNSPVTDFDSASPKTAGLAIDVNDRLVVLTSVEDQSGPIINVAGGSQTYTLLQSIAVSNFAEVRLHSCTSSTATDFSVSFTEASSSSLFWFGGVVQYRDSDGFGNSAKSNTNNDATPSIDITTTQDNSAIVVLISDWNAGAVTPRTWLDVNGAQPTEIVVGQSAGRSSRYVARYADAGTAGVKTVGLSAPTGMKTSIVAIEVKGVASSATPVGDDLALSYHTKAAVADTLAVSYHNRSSIFDTLAMSYAVRSLANDDLPVSYVVRSAAFDTLSISYQTRALIADEIAFLYNTLSGVQVGDDLPISYHTRFAISDQMPLSFNTLAAIADTLPILYTVRSAAFDTLPLSYAVRQAIADTLPVSYRVLTSAFDTLPFSYIVRQAVGGNLQFEYNVDEGGVAGNILEISYQVRAALSDILPISYHARGSAFDEIPISYHTRIAANDQVPIAYRILQVVQENLAIAYGIRALASDVLPILYHVQSIAPTGGPNPTVALLVASNGKSLIADPAAAILISDGGKAEILIPGRGEAEIL